MEHLPSVLTRQESDALASRIAQSFAAHQLGLWAIEVPGVAPFIGFAGLAIPTFEAHFTPCVEVGWRLARPFWGAGYATEAARAAVGDGFKRLGLREIVSFTVPANARSWGVMERLGMHRAPEDDFDHPKLPAGHRLARHVLYRLTRAEWETRAELPLVRKGACS
jgi:RimJ/RimL family protein N-acetyltransferase